MKSRRPCPLHTVAIDGLADYRIAEVRHARQPQGTAAILLDQLGAGIRDHASGIVDDQRQPGLTDRQGRQEPAQAFQLYVRTDHRHQPARIVQERQRDGDTRGPIGEKGIHIGPM